jgi:8-oxo-dGTP diphosphatase
VAVEKRVQVAVGILVRRDGCLLIQQRRAGTDCAGYWEFPGGKLETGESPEAALKRELSEELGILIERFEFLSELQHDYSHANVSLFTFLVHKWSSDAKGKEGQKIAWDAPKNLPKYDLLAAAYPLLKQAEERLRSTP